MSENLPHPKVIHRWELTLVLVLIVIGLLAVGSTYAQATPAEPSQANPLAVVPTPTAPAPTTRAPVALHAGPYSFTLPYVTVSGGQPGGPGPNPQYIVIGWNDLGMHCYNRDFSDIGILPPYNNLYVQVIKRGNPPQIVSSGLSVEYSFPLNTYSVGKSNFWTYANKLFGVTLAPNMGLKGKGLAGTMDNLGDHFVAEGIPLTEYNDSDWNTRQPFQLANIVVKNGSGQVIATNQVVAPVSTEMHCDNCHSDGAFGISTGKVETNILTLHDRENASDYPAGHTGLLMNRRPVLCAECHSSNAIGAPGLPDIPSFSNAMHEKHAGKVPNSTDGCYNCHPGPTTKCLRDVMSTNFNMNCTSCHGDMNKVSQNPNPWLNEPRCDGCHTGAGFKQDAALYRQSHGHGGLYCEACHDSTHAIAPSTQANDAVKFINLQGHSGTLDKCTVCHVTQPTSGGPHK